MTTTEYDDDILTLDDVERVFREVLENSWPLPREDLERAVDEFADWASRQGWSGPGWPGKPPSGGGRTPKSWF